MLKELKEIMLKVLKAVKQTYQIDEINRTETMLRKQVEILELKSTKTEI